MTNPIYLVVSLWIREDNIAAFEAYEQKAQGIMQKYGGSIEKIIRLVSHAEQTDQPFEVHLVRFPNSQMFNAYRLDAEYKALSLEREAVITKTAVLTGYEILPHTSHFPLTVH